MESTRTDGPGAARAIEGTGASTIAALGVDIETTAITTPIATTIAIAAAVRGAVIDRLSRLRRETSSAPRPDLTHESVASRSHPLARADRDGRSPGVLDVARHRHG
jgi:hypothetical protein